MQLVTTKVAEISGAPAMKLIQALFSTVPQGKVGPGSPGVKFPLLNEMVGPHMIQPGGSSPGAPQGVCAKELKPTTKRNSRSKTFFMSEVLKMI